MSVSSGGFNTLAGWREISLVVSVRGGRLTRDPNGLSGLPHSFSGAAESGPDGLAELTPIPEMADEARNVAQPPSDVSHARRVVGAELVGGGVDVPNEGQRDRDRADECARNQDKARDSEGAKCRGRRGSRPGVAYAGSGFVAIRLDTALRAVGSGDLPAKAGVWRTAGEARSWKEVRTKASFTGSRQTREIARPAGR